MNQVSTHDLASWLTTTLQPQRFRDYCPNGLQVEGKSTLRRIVTGVTASQALLEAALSRSADAIVVHHGWFWKNEDPCVRGTKRRRLALTLANELNVFAYHLPLDAHPELGNNVQLARHMGWSVDSRTGEHGLICLHDAPRPLSVKALAAALRRRLGRAPLAVGALDRPIGRIAWCTGAAQDMLEQAIDAGADAFISGEISERTTHLAREAGVVYLAAGHHATERYGVQALGAYVGQRFGIAHRFIDDDNPV